MKHKMSPDPNKRILARPDGINFKKLLFPVIIALLVFSLAYAVIVAQVIPKRYEFKVGDTANETITAPWDIEDTITTEALKNAARSSVQTVYAADKSLASSIITEAEAFFDSLDALRTAGDKMRVTKIEESTVNLRIPIEGPISIANWKKLLNEQDLAKLREEVIIPFDDAEIFALLSADSTDLVRLHDAVIPKITTALTNGLKAANIQSTLKACSQELSATTLSVEMKSIGDKAFSEYLRTTMLEDAAKTEKLQEEAAAAVKTVIIKKGETIVSKGDKLSEAQIAALTGFGLIRSQSTDVMLITGIALGLILLIAVLGGYIYLFEPDTAKDPKKVLLVGLILSVTILLSFVFGRLDYRFNPAFYAVLLIAVLVSKKTAIVANIVMAIFIAFLSGGRQDILGFNAIAMLLSSFIGGSAGIYMTTKAYSRSKLMIAGLAAGVAAAVMTIALDLMRGTELVAVLINSAWALGSNLIATVICLGTILVWENFFDVATSARLIELSNTNYPLLKQLMTEAYGTYHHSMMVASLAEAAAQQIKADSLLARVGGYYHDVGKLRHPHYFKENQRGENPLEELSASEAAGIILAHVKDGVQLCQKYKLPSKVVSIVAEHHGNTPVVYFYDKALKEAEGSKVSLKAFRYPALRPTSKESTIVMLADSVEAGVRSLPDFTREDAAAMVSKIIRGKIDDEQLSLSPITFQELMKIENSFIKTLSGLMHERVEYPDIQITPERKKRH